MIVSQSKLTLHGRSPPEELVLPKRFPKAPFPAAAALISPLAWQIGRPDLFDAYSAGILLMQMAGERAAALLRKLPHALLLLCQCFRNFGCLVCNAMPEQCITLSVTERGQQEASEKLTLRIIILQCRS